MNCFQIIVYACNELLPYTITNPFYLVCLSDEFKINPSLDVEKL